MSGPSGLPFGPVTGWRSPSIRFVISCRRWTSLSVHPGGGGRGIVGSTAKYEAYPS
jgi:hypothetical protein